MTFCFIGLRHSTDPTVTELKIITIIILTNQLGQNCKDSVTIVLAEKQKLMQVTGGTLRNQRPVLKSLWQNKLIFCKANF